MFILTFTTGLACEIDTDPCASSPCLYGGRCKPVDSSDYTCECVGPNLHGKRCQFGRYCSPNPCVHGGICEEGNNGPICKCQGFTGDRCELDVNECESNPCTNGGTCVNEIGAYRCICTSSTTGTNCEDQAYLVHSIMGKSVNITRDQLLWIATIVAAHVVFFTLICTCKFIRSKRNRARANMSNDTRKQIVLNSSRSIDNDFKRNSKLSEMDVIQVFLLFLFFYSKNILFKYLLYYKTL